MKMKVLLVAGARPNYMKIAPIHWAVTHAAREVLDVEIVHTGQHYDARLSGDFFRDLELPEPSVNHGTYVTSSTTTASATRNGKVRTTTVQTGTPKRDDDRNRFRPTGGCR